MREHTRDLRPEWAQLQQVAGGEGWRRRPTLGWSAEVTGAKGDRGEACDILREKRRASSQSELDRLTGAHVDA